MLPVFSFGLFLQLCVEHRVAQGVLRLALQGAMAGVVDIFSPAIPYEVAQLVAAEGVEHVADLALEALAPKSGFLLQPGGHMLHHARRRNGVALGADEASHTVNRIWAISIMIKNIR